MVGSSGGFSNARMTRVEYDAAGNQTRGFAVEQSNMQYVGPNGEKLAGYDETKDIVTAATFDNLGYS